MISSEFEVKQTLEQIELMYHSLLSLRAEVFPKNPRLYKVMCEGPVAEIRAMLQELNEYVGVTDLMEHPGLAPRKRWAPESDADANAESNAEPAPAEEAREVAPLAAG